MTSVRRFIIDLAVRGKLLEQNPADTSASEALAAASVAILPGKRERRLSVEFPTPEEHPFSIPPSWLWCRLSQVGLVVGGGTPPTSDDGNFTPGGTGTPWLTPADLGRHRGATIDHGARDLTPKGLAASGATLMPKGTVLFTSRAPIGYVAIAATEVTTNQGFKSLVPSTAVDPGYVAAYLRAFLPLFEARAPGTTFKEVSAKLLSAFPFPLAPLAEQRRIVAKVDELIARCDHLESLRAERERVRDGFTVSTFRSLDEDAESTGAGKRSEFFVRHFEPLTARADQVSALRLSILRQAVRGRVVRQDTRDEPASSLLGERECRLSPAESPWPLPAGWSWTTYRRLGESIGGGTPSKANEAFWNGSIPWVSPKDMKVDRIFDAQDHVAESAVAATSVRLIPSGALLMVVRGMILAHSFPTALTTDTVTINQDMKALVPFESEIAPYLLLVSKALKPEVLRLVERSTHGTCRLPTESLFTLPIPIPPLAEQHRIVAKVETLMELCAELEKSLASVQAGRGRALNAVMHKALATDHVVSALA
jgi:type I restriction enzyme, S subunit